MKKKLANRSDRQPQSARKNRSGVRGRRSPCGNGATVRRGVDPADLRKHARGIIKAQHRQARLEAARSGLKLVTEAVAQLIRMAGGPPYAPVAPTGGMAGLTEEHTAEFLTGMPQGIVSLIQSPPAEWAGLKIETKVMLAVEEWRALNPREVAFQRP